METTALRRPFLNEYTMEQWDAWRSYIHKGGTASWPRDAFKALIDGIDEERREAADAIESLFQRVDEARAELKTVLDRETASTARWNELRDKHEAAIAKAEAGRVAAVVRADWLEAAREKYHANKDAAYRERSAVVALLASMAFNNGWPVGTKRTDIPGWSEDWHGCVYIDLPAGQVSWHYHDSHADLFGHLPPYAGNWDGHDTPKKYERVAAEAVRQVEGGR